MKKIILFLLLLTTISFGQYKFPSPWKLSGTTLSPVNSTWMIGGLSLHLNTATANYHTLALGNSTATNLNSFNFTDTDINKIRTNASTSRDTSAISGWFTLTGSPYFQIMSKTGTSLLKIDSTVFRVGDNNTTGFLSYTPSIGKLSGIGAGHSNDWFIQESANNLTEFSTFSATMSVNGNGALKLSADKGTTGHLTIASTGAVNFSYKIRGQDSLTTHSEVSSLADSASITIATGVAGWGEVMIGDNQEWAHFRFKADGTVTLITNTTNVATDGTTDNTLNIYDGGSGIIIKNLLGSRLKCAVKINYYTP